MRKSVCQITIKDLLNCVEEAHRQRAHQAEQSGDGQPDNEKEQGWLSLDEISSVLNLEPDILNRFMLQESGGGKAGNIYYYRVIHTKM